MAATHYRKPRAKRTCLRCRREFWSEGIGNHVCRKCNLENLHPGVKYWTTLHDTAFEEKRKPLET